MQVGQDNLKSDALLAHERFEGCWSLVVQNLEGWAETTLGQLGLQSRVCQDEFVIASLFQRLGKNGVAIMVIKDNDIIAAATGGHRKMAILIGCNFSCELDDLGKYFVGPNTGCIRSSWWSKRFGDIVVCALWR